VARTVFFSWQSDRPPREGRNLVEKALGTAVARIAGDLDLEEAVRDGLTVDKDTKDVPGSPPIFQTILAKIDRASVFVADLTFCGERCRGRLSPNPNVLIEYGWALKSLSYFQLLTVMNEAYGGPSAESLPFDLAQLRFPMTYNLPDGAPAAVCNREREILAKRLETALRAVLESEEFKSKLQKRPEPLPFPRKAPANGRARFRAPEEPLGFALNIEAQMTGMGGEKAVYLSDGPAAWLRLAPGHDSGRRWLNQKIKEAATSLAALPLAPSYTNIGSVRGKDGYGYYSTSDNDKTHSVSFVFNTGEVWVINAWAAMVPGHFELDEPSFTKTMDECVAFLDRLGCPKPYWWTVGIEGMQGRHLVARDGFNRYLRSCLADVIEDEGTYGTDDNAADLLRPFFESVFDQCGVTRPSR
jgi:hypothetical protein